MITPVVLSGGFGTRLWPISRQHMPKQFMRGIFDETLFAKAIKITSNSAVFNSPVIVSHKDYKFLILDEMHSRQYKKIILESQPRNTAASIALAAFSLLGEDAPMLIIPSDHLISSVELFEESILNGLPLVESHIVTFGVRPSFPSTGYGYIERGSAISSGFKVKRFCEKPDIDTAEHFVASGAFLWNCGIFLVKPSVYLQELKHYLPETFHIIESIMQNASADVFEVPDLLLANMKDISVDCAILEKSESVAVCQMLSKWNDVGDFSQLAATMPSDVKGNHIMGDVTTLDVSSSNILGRIRPIAAIGLRDVTIVDSGDAILVAHNSRLQDIRKIVNILQGRDEILFPNKVFRAWGFYEILYQSAFMKVKRLVISAGKSLSLQSHEKRSETWVIARGTATVYNNGSTSELSLGESIFIAVGNKHRLSNCTNAEVEVIETQLGSYCGEDDIKRYENA